MVISVGTRGRMLLMGPRMCCCVGAARWASPLVAATAQRTRGPRALSSSARCRRRRRVGAPQLTGYGPLLSRLRLLYFARLPGVADSQVNFAIGTAQSGASTMDVTAPGALPAVLIPQYWFDNHGIVNDEQARWLSLPKTDNLRVCRVIWRLWFDATAPTAIAVRPKCWSKGRRASSRWGQRW